MASYKTRFPMMGTFIDLVVHHERGEVIKECYLQLQEFTQRFTVNQSQSELMRVNNYAGIRPVRVKPDLYALIKKSKAISTPILKIRLMWRAGHWLKHGISVLKMPSYPQTMRLRKNYSLSIRQTLS